MEPPFREVHKCSWLKLLGAEKKSSSVAKWVIYCVHNDSIPFLEVYSDEKMALTHKPTTSYELTNVLHITPSICPHDDDEYEFVVTFPSEMIRFVASSQHQMMSWVKRLNAKLREMKLMAPSENLYTSHLPENRSHLLPTRDPNSPLPLPPTMPYIPPGVEPVSSSSTENSENQNRIVPDSSLENAVSDNSPNSSTNANSRIISPPLHESGSNSTNNENRSPVVNAGVSDPVSPQNRSSDSRAVNTEASRSSSNNVTVIEVSSTSDDSVFSFGGVNSELNSVERHEDISVISVMPVSSSSENASPLVRQAVTDIAEERNSSNNPNVNSRAVKGASQSSSDRAADTRLDSPLLTPNSNLYEHVFLPPTTRSTTPCNSHSGAASSPLSPVAVDSKFHAPITSVNMQSSSSQLPKMGRGRGNVRGRRRSNSSSEGSSNHQPLAADRIRTAGPILSPNPRLQPAPHPFVRQVNSEEATNTRLTLREQQVMQLRREISHPGGVRLQLRTKDCLNSIAFIDAFQAVWIAGWKQKEHPMLYTALHIGDQLISLGGKIVNNAADAQKLIRGWPSLYIEFVIRRVPCGRVYALRKEQEGQNLGIVQENNTAEIKEVVSKSIVAAQGLTSRVRTMNGLSWTTWYITEINGRPLNPFFKDNEVKDRLNAVGLDISLLVQPSDLIKQIKKQLKQVKNYKDYIVQ
ncbi:hypothetical protein V9T40_004873 [Parthenolecanium corni]|uniref:PH domain-containing protein n=1 Tax=Parthenolecanium corni TaxID=536013 RepID=A0AAN9TD47_9HEMI